MKYSRILDLQIQDLYYNLALEHALLLLHSKNDYTITVRFWRNPKSVIVGRNQLVEDEIDLGFCHNNNILIGRRISGGGTVYHDDGNLNISFYILKKKIPNVSNMKEITEFFTDLLIESLRTDLLNLKHLERMGSSNILYKGKKVSGSAGYLRNNWVLHHATLLLSANLENLENSLLAKLNNQGVKRRSEYYPTTNLPHLKVQTLKTAILKTLDNYFDTKFRSEQLTTNEITLAKKLSEEMYSQSSWIIDKKRVNF